MHRENVDYSKKIYFLVYILGSADMVNCLFINLVKVSILNLFIFVTYWASYF